MHFEFVPTYKWISWIINDVGACGITYDNIKYFTYETIP